MQGDVIENTARRRTIVTPAIDLLRIIAARWLLALVLFAVFTGLGIAWLARQAPTYEIKAVVAEKKDSLTSSASGLSSLTGGLLGLAQQPSGVKTLQEAVYSAELADYVTARFRLDRVIFEDRWDARLRRWKPAKGAIPGFVNLIRGLFGAPVSPDITSTDVQNYLVQIMFIKSDIDAGNTSIQYFYRDRRQGARILDIVLEAADAQARAQQRKQIDARLRYLYSRLRQAQFPEQIAALTNLIQRLETQNAVINADRTFTVDILSPPRASLQISRPRYPLVFGLIIITAGFLTLAVIWSLAAIRPRAAVITDDPSTSRTPA